MSSRDEATPSARDSATEPVTRRRALSAIATGLASLWAAAIAMVAGLYISSPLRAARQDEDTLVGDLSSFGPQYTAVRLRIPVQDGWYKRVAIHTVYVRTKTNGTPEVLSGTCTHLSCTVSWIESEGAFQCPCHGARFAGDGSVLAGPPSGPLPHVPASVRENAVYVRLA